ncbi:MAG: response regulator [bacterium]|nr:response regulator [bacterium]
MGEDAGKNKKIVLVVEDEKPLAEAIGEYLGGVGYDVKNAYNGNEALKMLQTMTPDVVLLDIVLPEMNGVAVLKAMQDESSPARNVPVIVFSNLVGEKAWIEQMGLRVVDYLVKANSSLAEVAAKVKQVLGL